MTWYKDLSECDYYGNVLPIKPIAVGWLEKGKPYTKGKLSEQILENLTEFIETRGITHAFLGIHECDLCDVELPRNQLNIIDGLGSRITFVAYKEKLYIFPDLIIHYINTHFYLPPAEFIEAALASTPQETIEYFDRILQNEINTKNK